MLTETLTANGSSFLLRGFQVRTHFLQSLLQNPLSVPVDQLHRQTTEQNPAPSVTTSRGFVTFEDNSSVILTWAWVSSCSTAAIFASRLFLRSSSVRRASVRSVSSRPRRTQSCLRRASSAFCLQGRVSIRPDDGHQWFCPSNTLVNTVTD